VYLFTDPEWWCALQRAGWLVRPAVPEGGRDAAEPGGGDRHHDQQDRAAGHAAEQGQVATVTSAAR